jgi:hypothetical protein
MTDVYKIGITVALTNLIGSELTRIAKEFGVADSSAKGFGLALGGVAVVMAGVTAAMAAGINEARKFQVEVAKFSLYGMGDKINRDAREFAENIRIAGVSATESMHFMNEAQGVFRQSGRTDTSALEGAKIALPMLEKIAFIDKALYGKDDGGGSSSESLAMLRWIDMTGGANDPKRFNELADLGFRLIHTSGGQIDWEGLRQFRARAKSAGFGMSDEMYAMVEPIIGELKGMTAGNSLSTAYNRAHGITKPTNQAVAEWMKLRLWDKNKIQLNSLGGVKQFSGDPLVDAEGFDNNFVKWYLEHVKPEYDRLGLSKDQRIRENALLFNSTGGNLMSLVDRQASVIAASQAAVNKALGVDPSYNVAKDTVDGKLVQLTAEWATLMKQIGTEILPAVNAGLGYLVRVLGGFIKTKDKEIATAAADAQTHDFLGFRKNDATPPRPATVSTPVTVNMHIDGEVVARKTVDVFLGRPSSDLSGNLYDGRTVPFSSGWASATGQ